jgi:uncharacterized protein (TIGR03083 family)
MTTPTVAVWAECRQSMSELGRRLEADEAELVVPTCPEWTVRQVFAHQAGVAADLLSGRLEGVATDPWTERQVQEREGRTLAEVLDEWDADAPRLVEALRPLGDDVDRRLVLDVWAHEQDVRHAVGQPGSRSGPAFDFVVGHVQGYVEHHFAQAGLDPTGVDVGDGRSDAVVQVDPFELVRAVFGRRSADQVMAWAWTVDDPSPYVAAMPAFAFRPDALEEPS